MPKYKEKSIIFQIYPDVDPVFFISTASVMLTHIVVF